MADCINEIEIEKNSFHIKDSVLTKLFEFLETLNRTALGADYNSVSVGRKRLEDIPAPRDDKTKRGPFRCAASGS